MALARIRTVIGGTVASALLGAWIVVSGIPLGEIIRGALVGGLISLSAMGLVLIWRAQRFLNVAHISVAIVCGVATAQLFSGAGWSFVAAAAAGVCLGIALGLISELLLVGRLGKRPRALVMAASIGWAQVLGGVAIGIALFKGVLPSVDLGFGFRIKVFPTTFSDAHLFAAIGVPLTALSLGLFLRTRTGLALRAVAVNPIRAATLGINARGISLVTWMVAGALAAISGILAVPLLGIVPQANPAPGVLLLALAPAALARMQSLVGTAIASIGVGIAYQVALWTTDRAYIADLLLAGLVIAALGLVRVVDAPTKDESGWAAFLPIRSLPQRRRQTLRVFRMALGATATAVAISVVLLVSPSVAQRIGTIAVFAIAAVGISVVSGLTGRISLGGWALGIVGAVVAIYVTTDAGVGLVVAMGAGAAAAAAASAPIAAAETFAFAAATLSVAAAAQAWSTVALAPASSGVATRIGGMSLQSPYSAAILTVVVLACVLWGLSALRHSSYGKRIVAARDNQALAIVHGIRPAVVRLVAFSIAGGVAGLAGYLYVVNQVFIHPDSFRASRSFDLLAMTVVGGISSMWGAVAGAATIGAADLFLSGPWSLVASGAGMLAILLIAPGGVVALAAAVRERWIKQ